MTLSVYPSILREVKSSENETITPSKVFFTKTAFAVMRNCTTRLADGVERRLFPV